MKKNLYIFLIVLIAAAFTFTSCNNKDLIVGNVNNLPVYAEELELYKKNLRAGVAAEYSAKYKIDEMGEDFWYTPFDGQTPEAFLIEKSKESLIKDKVIQSIAVKRGIVAPGDYTELAKARKEENDVSSGDKFGPTSLGEYEYLSYQMSHTIDDIKAHIKATEKPSEKDLEQAFASLSDTVKREDFSANGIVFSSSLELKPMQEIVLSYYSSSVVNWYEKIDNDNITYTDFSLNSADIHREDIDTLALAEGFYDLNPQDFYTYNNNLYFVQNITGGKLLSYEDAPQLAENKWINDQFDQLVTTELKNAEIEFNTK